MDEYSSFDKTKRQTSMGKETPNYYAVIPAEVRYADIKANAKLLYSEITALANRHGYCWANDGYFAELYSTSKDSIQKWLKQLEDNGFISREIIYEEGTKKIKQRKIYLLLKNPIPTIKNNSTPTIKNNSTPTIKNNRDNNTSINNTSINNNMSIGGLKPADLETFFYSLVKELQFTEKVKFTDLRKRKLIKRLKLYKQSELSTAAKNIAADGFMQGDNPSGRRYGDIDYLLRSDETVEKWLLAGEKESDKEFIERGLRDF